jgi:hypothetical protein
MGPGLQALDFGLEKNAIAHGRVFVQPKAQSPRPRARCGGAS